ncbi:methyltransferase domain-containing protein [Nocardia sp. NPDC004260]
MSSSGACVSTAPDALLDMGCGTGQLTVPLARHMADAVGMYPEPTMLVEAARRAEAAGVANVAWTRGGSADLPAGLGRFRLVTMGRSFHRMLLGDRRPLSNSWSPTHCWRSTRRTFHRTGDPGSADRDQALRRVRTVGSRRSECGAPRGQRFGMVCSITLLSRPDCIRAVR